MTAPESQVQPPPQLTSARPTRKQLLEGFRERTEWESPQLRGPAVQHGKPRLAQGPPRHPFQTRDACESGRTRAPHARDSPTAGRFVRRCHPKSAATLRRAQGAASPYLRALARQGALARVAKEGWSRTASCSSSAVAASAPLTP